MATTYTRFIDPDSTTGGNGESNALEGDNRAYVSLNACEAARQVAHTNGDITAATGDDSIEEWICDSNGVSHTADTIGGVSILGWTTAAGNYISIHTPADSRHLGTWTEEKYRLEISNYAYAIGLGEEFIRIDGLQIAKTSTNGNLQAVIACTDISVSDFWISNCILKQAGNALYTEPGIYFNDAGIQANIWNCIIYGMGTNAAANNSGILLTSVRTTNGVKIYNCTIAGGYYGINRIAGLVTAKNTYCGNSAAGDFNGTITETYCASSDTTASGTGCATEVLYNTDTFVNVTGGSENLHLAADGNSPLQDAGEAPGGSAPLNYTTDIDGETITTWSIGADSYVGTDHIVSLTDDLNAVW